MATRELRNLFWYMFVATRGGPTRARLVRLLIDEPANAKRLAEKMGMDYTTIRHHLSLLVKNGFLGSQGDKYNVVYFPSDLLESNCDLFDEIWKKINSQERGSNEEGQ